MAHYAFLNDDNIVEEVIVGTDENKLIDGLAPEVWYSNFRGKKCIRTSYNNKIRKQYAGKGFTYDPDADVFIAPSPFPSWFLNENYDWVAPKEKPEGSYFWDENLKDWIYVEDNT